MTLRFLQHIFYSDQFGYAEHDQMGTLDTDSKDFPFDN
jgi:hypothetical protein